FQVKLDLAAYIINLDTNKIAATFDDDNPNVDQACETIQWTNDQNTDNLAFAFRLKSSSAPSRVAWVYFDNGGIKPINAQAERARTIVGHRLEIGAIACGAAPAQGATQPENFSSFGGNMEVFFAPDGTRFATPAIRQKPDVTGPDNVHTTFFEVDDGNGGGPFSRAPAPPPPPPPAPR